MRIIPVAAAVAALLGACGGSSEPPLSTATSLACPAPGELPFRLSSYKLASSDNQDTVDSEPRIKDEAADSLGNPGGLQANIYLTDDAMVASGPIDYHGRKARTAPTTGLRSTPITGEYTSLWFHDDTAGSGSAAWHDLGRTQTDDNGYYDLPATGFVAPNGAPVYSILEGDGSCAVHRDYFYPAGEQVVVADIDGTLTLSDDEQFMELGDDTYVPKQMGAAATLMQTWAMKGYPVIYLTAREHVERADTVAWLDSQQFPPGAIITTDGTDGADVYKSIWLARMVNNFGWQIEAAYGNATTDITAYQSVNVPADRLFIVGGLMQAGTTVIPNNDFTDHITNFVDLQPDND